MSDILTTAGAVVVLLGAVVFASAALGLIRFPDVYTRVSAVGTAGGIGIVLIMVGTLLLQPSVPNLLKIALAIALQLGTSAIGTIALARSAYLTRTRMRRQMYDELAAETSVMDREPGAQGPPPREG